MKTKITLIVEDSSPEMAHQLLAMAIKKKYKNKIRPFYELHTDGGMETVESHDLQNDLWIDDSGTPYDY